MNKMRQELEILLAQDCYRKQLEAEKAGKAFKCDCPLPENLSDAEVEKRLKELSNDK